MKTWVAMPDSGDVAFEVGDVHNIEANQGSVQANVLSRLTVASVSKSGTMYKHENKEKVQIRTSSVRTSPRMNGPFVFSRIDSSLERDWNRESTAAS
jgi:hypothetical protein